MSKYGRIVSSSVLIDLGFFIEEVTFCEMIIKKILNNNVVLSENKQQQEIVVMGKGLAFQKKANEAVEQEKVEKVFILEDEGMENLFTLYEELNPTIIDISTNIIKYAQGVLGVKLSNNIYITLPDHLNYAIERSKENLDLKSPLEWEIRRFYKAEYNIGKKALDFIEEELNVELPDSEAASIALHIVNSKQDNADMTQTIQITEMVQDILNIVSYHFGQTLDEETIEYSRLVTHLQYFARRVLSGNRQNNVDMSLLEQIKIKYPDAVKCVDKINKYVKETYDTETTEDEKMYLTIHIERLLKEYQS